MSADNGVSLLVRADDLATDELVRINGLLDNLTVAQQKAALAAETAAKRRMQSAATELAAYRKGESAWLNGPASSVGQMRTILGNTMASAAAKAAPKQTIEDQAKGFESVLKGAANAEALAASYGKAGQAATGLVHAVGLAKDAIREKAMLDARAAVAQDVLSRSIRFRLTEEQTALLMLREQLIVERQAAVEMGAMQVRIRELQAAELQLAEAIKKANIPLEAQASTALKTANATGAAATATGKAAGAMGGFSLRGEEAASRGRRIGESLAMMAMMMGGVNVNMDEMVKQVGQLTLMMGLLNKGPMAGLLTGAGVAITVLAGLNEMLVEWDRNARKVSDAMVNHVSKLNSLQTAQRDLAQQNMMLDALYKQMEGKHWWEWYDKKKIEQNVGRVLEVMRLLQDKTLDLAADEKAAAIQRERSAAQAAAAARDELAIARQRAAMANVEAGGAAGVPEWRKAQLRADQEYELGVLEATVRQAATIRSRVTYDKSGNEIEGFWTKDEERALQAQLSELDRVRVRARVAAKEQEFAFEREQVAARAGMLRATVNDELAVKLAAIEAERRARLKAGWDAVEVERLVSDARKRMMQETLMATLDKASQSAYALSRAMRASGNAGAGAMAGLGQAIEKFKIAMEGKDAAIMAAKEWGASMSAYASGNIWGGTLHAASAAQYTLAAAAAGVGVFGKASTGGGMGDSRATAPTAGGAGAGAFTLILQTVNPFSGETVNWVRYELDRAEAFKRPVSVPPTTGLMRAGA